MPQVRREAERPLAERQLLLDPDHRDLLGRQPALLDEASVKAMQAAARAIHVAPAAADYILALVQRTRDAAELRQGLSPRGGLAVRRAAQAWALLDGRDAVLPEDIQQVFPAVVGHRLQARPDSTEAPPTPAEILAAVPLS